MNTEMECINTTSSKTVTGEITDNNSSRQHQNYKQATRNINVIYNSQKGTIIGEYFLYFDLVLPN